MSVKDVWEKKKWKKKTYTDTGMNTDTHIHLLTHSVARFSLAERTQYATPTNFFNLKNIIYKE